MPTVDCERQCSPHTGIVKRFLLVVRLYQTAAIPVALLHNDLVTERLDEFVARRGRQPTKFHRGAPAADCIDPNRLLLGVYCGKTVKVRQSLSIIIGVSYPLHRLTGLVFGELEGPGAEDVFLVPPRILVEHLLLVDEGKGIGECRQECACCKLQTKDHSRGVGRRDRIHHIVIALADAQYVLGRVNDMLPARYDIGGGQWRAIVELDPLAYLEGVGSAIIGWLWYRSAEVADEICRR